MRACSQNRSRRPCQVARHRVGLGEPKGDGWGPSPAKPWRRYKRALPLPEPASRRKSGYRGNLALPAAPPMHTTGREPASPHARPCLARPRPGTAARLRLGGVCKLRSRGPIIHAASAAAVHGNVSGAISEGSGSLKCTGTSEPSGCHRPMQATDHVRVTS